MTLENLVETNAQCRKYSSEKVMAFKYRLKQLHLTMIYRLSGPSESFNSNHAGGNLVYMISDKTNFNLDSITTLYNKKIF